jgi:hypothetical protein
VALQGSCLLSSGGSGSVRLMMGLFTRKLPFSDRQTKVGLFRPSQACRVRASLPRQHFSITSVHFSPQLILAIFLKSFICIGYRSNVI